MNTLRTVSDTKMPQILHLNGRDYVMTRTGLVPYGTGSQPTPTPEQRQQQQQEREEKEAIREAKSEDELILAELDKIVARLSSKAKKS